MIKKNIYTIDCMDGDILAEDIINRYGVPIIYKNVMMNAYIKQRLLEIGVKKISVYVKKNRSSENIEEKLFQRFKESYIKNILKIIEISNELVSGGYFNIKKLELLSESLYEQIMQNEFIIKCLEKTKKFSEYTYEHCLNVSFYCMLIGRWCGFSKKEVLDICTAGILHDIGEKYIPSKILNKKEKLFPSEFNVIREHPIHGYNLIKSVKEISSEVKNAVLTHHERMDGSGYPFKLKRDKICDYSKVLAVADVFDAVTSDRVYRKRMSPFEAFEIFLTEGIDTFDTSVIRVFLKNMPFYYIGLKVLLNSGECGEIVYIPPHDVSKPVVKVNNTFYDLSLHKNMHICYSI